MRANNYLYLGLGLILAGILGLTVVGAILPGFNGGCARRGPSGWQGFQDDDHHGYRMRRMMRFMMRDYSKSSYASNGERLYLIGENKQGRRIQSNFGDMPMMKNFSCANCHGRKGRGGLVMPDGKKSANITRRALTTGEKKEGEPPFNDRLLKRAITEGIDNEGEALSPYMPRWRLPARDLDDLIEYLKNL